MKLSASTAQIDAAFRSDAMRNLARIGVCRSFPPNSIIINEGDPGGSLYLVLAGEVQVFSASADAREFIHGIYGPGEYVGEMSLDGSNRSASVKTTMPTMCIVIPSETLLAHFRQYPDLAFELLTRVIDRARIATESAKTLALLDVYGRVARLLDQLAPDDTEGVRLIGDRLTHQEIANRIGASREMVSKILKDLLEGGYLSLVNNRIGIVKELPRGW